jgi:hypothetical protein
MKLLYIVQQHKRTIFTRLQESIAHHAGDCDIHHLSDDQQKNLAKYFEENIDVKQYDRILIMVRLKRIMTQLGFLQTLPNLCFLEIDAWQNFHRKSKYRGKFSRFYSSLPWTRVISTGYQVSEKLRAHGLDVSFVPKGYDQQLIKNLEKPRSIELGFIGSLKSGFYSDRRNFLLKLANLEPLLITRTNPGRDYVEKMNETLFFISADINFDEYMIKNFEAMAAGCVLYAYDQGEAENHAIGLRDMENIVLYRSLDDLRDKLKILRSNSTLALRIANQGQAFAETHCTFEIWGKRIVDALQPPLRNREAYALPSPQGWFNSVKARLRAYL